MFLVFDCGLTNAIIFMLLNEKLMIKLESEIDLWARRVTRTSHLL